MSIRTRIAAALVGAALVAAPLSAAAPASAATPSHHNVLRGFCANIRPSTHLTTDCVADANDDARTLAFRDSAGHLRRYKSQRAALAFLRHHSKPCRDEDSPACYWTASEVGNREGSTFFSVGATTVYFADVTTRP